MRYRTIKLGSVQVTVDLDLSDVEVQVETEPAYDGEGNDAPGVQLREIRGVRLRGVQIDDIVRTVQLAIESAYMSEIQQGVCDGE